MRALALLVACVPLAAQAQAKWRLVEAWRKGGAIEGAYAFDGVLKHAWTALASAPGGRIVWLDAENSRMHVYDSAGTVIRSIGRDGSGPGEFRSPMGFAVAGDGRILVHDQRNGRYVLFTASGEFERVVPVRRRPAFAFGITWDGSFDRTGRVLQSVSIPPKTPASRDSPPPMFVDSVLLTERMAPDLLKSDSVLLCGSPPPIGLNTKQHYLRSFGSGKVDETRAPGGPPPAGVGAMEIPFAEQRPFVRDRDGFEWAASVFWSGELFRRESGRCGTVVARVTLRGPQAVIPSQIRDTALMSVPAEFRARVPKEYPWFRALRIDDQNRLWVERDVAAGKRFDVYSSAGQLVGEADLPANLDTRLPIAIAHNRVYGFVKTPDDVPYLVAWLVTTR